MKKLNLAVSLAIFGVVIVMMTSGCYTKIERDGMTVTSFNGYVPQEVYEPSRVETETGDWSEPEKKKGNPGEIQDMQTVKKDGKTIITFKVPVTPPAKTGPKKRETRVYYSESYELCRQHVMALNKQGIKAELTTDGKGGCKVTPSP